MHTDSHRSMQMRKAQVVELLNYFYATFSSLSVWFCVHLWLITLEFHRFDHRNDRPVLALVI